MDHQQPNEHQPSEEDTSNSDLAYRRRLCVAVLGPEIRNPPVGGGRKKQQIRDRLREEGHDAFYPESAMGPDDFYLDREVEMLSDPSVDLVIILQTIDSMGVAQELGAFVRVDEIVAKAVVFTPEQYYQLGQGLPANTLSRYHMHRPYSEKQFRTCHLVDICKMIVDDFLSDDPELFHRRQE